MRRVSRTKAVWLAAHPNRTQEWLNQRLAEDFHIHHVDGDSSNDDPRNLVLIEGLDHMLLHYTKVRRYLQERQRRQRKPISPEMRSIIGRKGGTARGASLTPEQRREAARLAARVRWSRKTESQ